MKCRSTAPKVLMAAMLTCMAAGEASAQAVEVYGVIGVFAGSVQRSGEKEGTKQLGAGGLTTSYLGFRGSEDLGNGLKMIFSLESFFRPDTGEQGRTSADPLFSRNAWVGVDSDYGRVTLGRQTNPTYAVMSQLSPFGSSVVFSPLTVQSFVVAYGRNIVGDTVWNNTVQYSTPDLKGFRGSVLYGTGEVPGHTGQANLGVHGTYRNGPFMAALSMQRVRINVNTPLPEAQDAWLAGATYDFGLLKLYGSAAGTRIDGGADTRLYDAGLSVPVSAAGTVLLEGARSRIDLPSGVETHRTTASFGYDHRLSKRTDVYAIYSYDKKTAASSGNTVALGVRHAF